MSNTIDVIKKLKEVIANGVSGLYIDNFPVAIADGFFPDAIVEELGTLQFPAILLRVYDSDFPEVSNAGQVYIEDLPIGIMIYADNSGSSDTQVKLLQIEDRIIDALSANADLGLHEANVFVSGINRGDRVEGSDDLYRVGFYDRFAISEITTTINYRRC